MHNRMIELKLRNNIFLFLFFIPLFLTAQEKSLVILHLNDTHSRIEPMPLNDARNPDKGGVVRQATYIRDVRKESKNVLVFHSGDMVQGTPYFNIFEGDGSFGSQPDENGCCLFGKPRIG